MKKLLLLGTALLGTILTGCAAGTGMRRFGLVRPRRPDTEWSVSLPDPDLCGLTAIGTAGADSGSGWGPLDAPAARPRRLGPRNLASGTQ